MSAACLLAGLGCQKIRAPKDAALKPIQEMLEQQVPVGMPRANVSLYLSTQGFTEEPAQEPGTIVTVIRKIDTEKLKPVTARVTFYFRADGKLDHFELQRTLNQPIP